MTQREWIEFGKMYDALLSQGPVQIINDDGIFCCITNPSECELFEDDTIQATVDITTCAHEWFDSPYEAIKYQYFIQYLGIEDTCNVDFELDSDLIREIEDTADDRGITVDEYIIEILNAALNNKKCNCCGTACG